MEISEKQFSEFIEGTKIEYLEEMSQQKPLVFRLFNSLAYFHLENVKWVKSFSHLLGGISTGI